VQALGSSTFRPYHTTDVRGVEIGGAAKNVLAIAAGIVEGRKLGASALAALTTRGFSELARLGPRLRRAQRNARRAFRSSAT
jgi:glycerol-3-phosphate dehydrogenase (NAD(P)+)